MKSMDVGGRIPRLRQAFGDAGCDALLVTRLVNIRYLTGFTGSAAVLLVRPDDLVFVTDGRYRDQSALELGGAGVEARIRIALTAGRQKEFLQEETAGVARLGLEAAAVTWAQQRKFDDEWFPEAELIATEGLVEELRKVKDAGEVDAIRAALAIQQRAFEAQIELARETKKPLVIHTRAAEDDTIRTLATEAEGLEVILHCFSMSARLDECLDHGWFVSFAGNVTYPSAQDLAEAAERVPDDRLLVETDAPYLTPQAVRKERNQPAFVAHTARFVAERRGIAYEELEAAVDANAVRLFCW